MLLLPLVFAVLQAADSSSTGAQDPRYSSDGRLVVAVHGDLWIRGAPRDSARWVQVTRGPAWDRQPAWSPDGASLVFASNASGVSHLWRVTLGRDGAVGTPERIGTAAEPESDPAVAPDGRLAFVRGSGSLARIWIRAADGTEHRLTRRDDTERWPAWSPDGGRIAYSTVSESRTRLRLFHLSGDSSRVVVEDRDAEHPAWSPNGDRILFASRNGRAGAWVTTPDARYVNLVSARRAAGAWSLDGRTIALVGLPPADVGYNGDP
ncbi:MAG: gamma-glutamyltranspeptidase, partial [Gemmatimonadetes bacterium]|nr:gamma-glutamyltranspeptidase [Gemmatimonadota bacterium]